MIITMNTTVTKENCVNRVLDDPSFPTLEAIFPCTLHEPFVPFFDHMTA